MDDTEGVRRVMVAELNSNPSVREQLEAKYGKDNVWDTDQVRDQFVVHSFLAPFVYVTRKSDGKQGLLMFQHGPRFYFDFTEK